MRFVSLVNSVVAKARRSVTQGLSVSDPSQEPDQAKLAETMRQVMVRVNKLEASTSPEGTEFEVNLGTGGGLVELFHNFKGPVRWFVVAWICTTGTRYPVRSPQIVQDSSSTSTSLFLRSYVAGRAVIRVESSQY